MGAVSSLAQRGLTLMLFLKMYPGIEKPFFLSIGSLKITSCSNRKTRLSLARDRKPLSCSLTVKVSCWSSLPRAVILPWYHSENETIKQRQRWQWGLDDLKTVFRNVCDTHTVSETYLEALKSAHVHHVIAAFWHKAHDLHSFLCQGQKLGCC